MSLVLPLVVVGGRAAVGPGQPDGPVVVGDLASVVTRAADARGAALDVEFADGHVAARATALRKAAKGEPGQGSLL